MTADRSSACRVGALLALLVLAPAAPAQVKYPPRPETVDVQIRYRIRADRDERVRQFRVLEAHLARLGFERKRQPGDETDPLDPLAERFEGTIPSKNVFAALDDHRVKTILFKPTDLQLPDDTAKPVPLRIGIPVGYLPAEQQRLHRQVVTQLARLGFREAVAYDHAGYTLVRGDLPAGNVFKLLKDLRTEPGGWFVSESRSAELPPPIRDTLPVRSVELLANADLDFFTPQPVPANRARYTPDLQALLADAAAAAKPLRVEIVLDHGPDGGELELIRVRLRAEFTRQVVNPATQAREAAFATLDGVVGNVMSITFPVATDVERFVTEPGVVNIRLPRAAVETVSATPAGAPITAADLLASTRVAAFHQAGYRGQGTRVAVVATDFPGLATAFGVRFLDRTLQTPVTLIDLTAELSPDLRPAAPAAMPAAAGTAVARAVHLAAPGAGLVLVRVDPAALFQVYTVARFVGGNTDYSEAIKSRFSELSFRTQALERLREDVVEEYRRANLSTSDEPGPVARRQRARQAFDALARQEADHSAAITRGLGLQNSMAALGGCDVVLNTLVWESGFALDGLSMLSQTIDTTFASEALVSPRTRSATRPRPAPRPLWVQPASPSVGSVWAGTFLDADGNGVMEFAGPGTRLPAGDWTREMNFLAARGADGATTPTLAAGTRVRLTVQWRETHDATGYGGQESVFPLTLRVLQQLDPEGKGRASDELKEVARTVGGPYRVVAEATYGVYEQILEFAVPADGRYCVMVEGQTVYDPRLPALRRQIEVQPRMLVEYLGATPDKGRPVFASYAPRDAGVGLPGDAKAAITVATADPTTGATTGLTGGGPGLSLLPKPDLYAAEGIDFGGTKAGGSGVAAGYTAGVLAGLVGSGAPPQDVIRATGLTRGGWATVSEGWLRVLVPKQAKR